MKRLFNKSITSSGSNVPRNGSSAVKAAPTMQKLFNQIDDLKEQLKETTSVYAMLSTPTYIALNNDAHDREHQKVQILQEEMEESWRQ